MHATIKKILTPPFYANPEEARKARIIHLLVLGILLIQIFYTIFILLFNPKPTANLIYSIVIMGIALFLLLLTHRQQLWAASYLLVSLTWLSVVVATILFGGIRSASFSSFAIVILITGLLINPRYALIATFITVATSFFIYFAESNGWYEAKIFALSMENALWGQVSNFLIIALLFYLAITDLGNSLKSAQENKQALAEAINESTVLLTTALDIDQVLDSILGLLARVIRYDSASIFLIQKDKLRLVAGQGHPNPTEVIGKLFASNSGVFKEIAHTKRPLCLENVQHDPRFARWSKEDYIRGWMGLPLIANNELLGFLTIDSSQIGAYGPNETAIASSFANQVATAILNAQLFQETQQRLTEQMILRSAMSAITESLDLPIVLQQIATQLGKAIDATSVYICSFEPNEITSTVLAEYFGPSASPLETESDLGVTYSIPKEFPNLLKAIATRQPQTSHITQADLFEAMRQHMEIYGAKSILLIPLTYRDEIIAFAELWESRQIRPFTNEEITLCQDIAQQATIALINAQLFEETQQQLTIQISLRKASQIIAETLDIGIILTQLAKQLCEIVVGTSAYINLVDSEAKTIHVEAEYFSDHASEKEKISDLGQTYTFYEQSIPEDLFINTPIVAHKDDQEQKKAGAAQHLAEYGAHSRIIIPVRFQDRLVAYAEVWESRYRRIFTEEEMALCADIANQAAVAIVNAQLYERVQNQTQLLEDKVERRTAQVIAVNEKLQIYTKELEKSNRELEAFAYVASHDLQEPLRKIQTFSDRLEKRYATEIDDRGRDYLRRMNSAASRMQALIIDLLSYSRIATREQPFQQVNLNNIVNEVIHDLSTQISQSKGQVIIADLPTIEADASQMRQLFQNLISNGLKFYHPDTAPIVKIYYESVNENEVQITVADNGIGFDEKYLTRIFEVFQRLHGRTQYQGTGVGLAICRKIVIRHQGSITAQSQPKQGAKFIITLPQSQQKRVPQIK